MTENSQFPVNARRGIQPGKTPPEGIGKPDAGAAGKGIADLIKGLGSMAGKAPTHQPILKSLEALGITLDVRDLDGKPCIVIDAQELMLKEYAKMSGVDPMVMLGKRTAPVDIRKAQEPNEN